MARPIHAEQDDCGCFRVLTSCFRRKGKDQPDFANDQSDQELNDHYPIAETLHSNASRLSSRDVLASLPSISPAPDAAASPIKSHGSVQSYRKSMSDPKPVDLWQEAFDKADKSTQDLIMANFIQADEVGDLISLVRTREEEFKANSAQIIVAGRAIYWRDCANRVITWITTCGDLAIHFAPAPSSTIWSALKVLLDTHVKECEGLIAILGCAEKALRLVRVGAVYEKAFLQDLVGEYTGPVRNIRDGLVDMYEKILNLLAHAKSHLVATNAARFCEALWDADKGQNLVQDLNAAEEQLGRYVQACEVEERHSQDEEVRKILQSLDEPLRCMDDKVTLLFHKIEDRELRKNLDFISQTHVGNQHYTRTKKRTEGTGQWLLKHPKFRNWENSSSSTILWLTGQVGAGKSILTSNVVDRYRIDNSHKSQPVDEGFAFFYYSKDDQTTNDQVVEVLRSFIRQLAQVPRYPGEIFSDLIKRCDDMKKNQRAFDSKLCQEILSSLVNNLPRTMFVLDGLDEFKRQDMRDVIGALVKLAKGSERPVKIFLSSRDRPDIRDELPQAGKILDRIVIVDENESDVKRFVEDRCQEIGRAWRQGLREKVVTDLCTGASGMFRWAYLQIEQLDELESDEAILERLGKLPKGLTEAYDELYNKNLSHDREYLQRAVKWAMHAKKPLSGEELLSAVRMSVKYSHDKPVLEISQARLSERQLEGICRHLIVKNAQDHWVIPHASVGEYFYDRNEEWIGKNAKVELAKLLLLVAIEACRYQPLLESNEETQSSIETSRDGGEDRYSMKPLRGYATNYWMFHIKAAQDEIDGCEEISQLLRRFMVAEEEPYRSTLEYQRWAASIGSDTYRLLQPIENPVFGLVVFKVYPAAKEWGRTCLQQNLESFNQDGLDLLALAAYHGDFELCGQLISWGMDVNRITPSGSTALWWAVHARQTACVRSLLEQNADPNLYKKSSPLCDSIGPSFDEDLLRLLLSNGCNPDAICKDCSFGCALECAAAFNRPEAAELLIEHEASVDLRLKGASGSPLAAAAYFGSLEVAKLLIKHGAEVNAYLETGNFGGVLAAASNCQCMHEMLSYLIEEAGADLCRLPSDLARRDPFLRRRGDKGIEDFLIFRSNILLDWFSKNARDYNGGSSAFHSLIQLFDRGGTFYV